MEPSPPRPPVTYVIDSRADLSYGAGVENRSPQREAEILAATFASANTIGEALGKLIVIPDREGKAKEAARWIVDVDDPLILRITASTTLGLLAEVMQLHGIDNREKLTEVLVKIWKVPDAPA